MKTQNKKITCYIRRVRPSEYNRVFHWVLETYPDIRGRNKILHRRDFDCKSVDEAVRIAKAVYGEGKINCIIQTNYFLIEKGI